MGKDENLTEQVTGLGQEPGPRHQPGVRHDERLNRLVEQRCAYYRRHGRAQHPAVESGDATLGYNDLDVAANRLARFLHRQRLGPGDRLAILLDRPSDNLTAQLAIAKLGAACIPIDATLPASDIAVVLADSGAGLLITTAAWAPFLGAADVAAVYLDRVAAQVEQEEALSPADERFIPPLDSPAYIMVHGDQPQSGVRATAVAHEAAANFVRVAGWVFGLGQHDRVFHDPRVGSDLAVLETWLPWASGATVITPREGQSLQGPALGRFLRERRVTVLRTDAATLSEVDVDLPDLRLLLLSGTDRPSDLLARWQRSDRQFLGVHGYPETTVVALWTELRPDDPQILGRPMPTYGVVVLDPSRPDRSVPHGEIGEIGITGDGVANGYVGRADLTREAFLSGAHSARIFRTGELGRITAQGEVERTGRVDGAAGRGTRLRPIQVATPSLTYDPSPPEDLQLPTPGATVGPASTPATVQAILSEILADVLQCGDVHDDAHFFEDLAADSMLMARFCVQIRKHPDLPSASMQDIYRHPTLIALASAIAPGAASPTATS